VIPPDCPGCSDFNPAAIPHMVVLTVLTPIIAVFAISMIMKALQRKKRVTFYLMMTILLFFGVILTSAYFNLISWIQDYRPAWGAFVNPIVYFLLSFSVFFLSGAFSLGFLSFFPRIIGELMVQIKHFA
jgi:hypothetical protein